MSAGAANRHSAALAAVLDGLRVVIFDADDTLRRTIVPGRPCPHAPEEWELLPNVRTTLREIDWPRRGIRLAVASNQDHVGYGLLSAAMAERLLRDTLDAATGGRARDPVIRFCPHRVEERCGCRKPAPGLLLDVLHITGARRHEALFVGNADSDARAAEAAGIRFLWANDAFRRVKRSRAAARDGGRK